MSVKERILHSLLFEAFALCILMVAARLFTSHNPGVVGGISLALSLLAMGWNYVYNLGFDHIFGHDRLSRKLGIRIVHGLGFEVGFLIVSIPLLMWVLQMDFWTVFILDLGVVIFFLVYSIIYNWAYDQVRSKITTRKAVTL